MQISSSQISRGAPAAWLTDKYIYVMLSVYPLFVGFHGYTRLTDSKFAFFAIATALWLLGLLIIELSPSLRSPVRKPGIIGVLIVVYLLLCCVAAVLSPFGEYVLTGAGRYDGLLTEILLVLIFLGVSQFATMKRSYVYVLGLSASVCCLVGILQLWGMDFLKLFPTGLTYYDSGIKYSGEFMGTIGNADPFSEFLCLALPLFCAYYITEKQRSFALLIPASLCCFCLFVSSVSGGKLAVMVCALVSAAFILRSSRRLLKAFELFFVLLLSLGLALAFHGEKNEGVISAGFSFGGNSALVFLCGAVLLILRLILKNKRFTPRSLSIFFASVSTLVVIGVLGAVYFFGMNAGGTVGELYWLLHGHVEDGFGSSRVLIWRRALELSSENPIFGSGPGTFSLMADIDFSRYVEETGKTLSSSVDNAHNIYLGILANTGLLSLIAFLSAQLLSLVKAIRQGFTPLSAALCCALLCFWIQGFFALGLFLVSPIAWIFWGLLANALENKVK